MSRKSAPEVHVVTGAPTSLTDDLGSRMKKYLWSMGIRTACFLLAVAFHGWLRWVFVAGAVILPYVAVVVANAGREPTGDGPAPYDATRAALTDETGRTGEHGGPDGYDGPWLPEEDRRP